MLGRFFSNAWKKGVEMFQPLETVRAVTAPAQTVKRNRTMYKRTVAE